MKGGTKVHGGNRGAGREKRYAGTAAQAHLCESVHV